MTERALLATKETNQATLRGDEMIDLVLLAVVKPSEVARFISGMVAGVRRACRSRQALWSPSFVQVGESQRVSCCQLPHGVLKSLALPVRRSVVMTAAAHFLGSTVSGRQ